MNILHCVTLRGVNKFFKIIFILLIFFTQISAEDNKFKFSGTIEYSNLSFSKDKENSDVQKMWDEINISPKLEYFPKDDIKFDFELLLRKNFKFNERSFYNFKELSMQLDKDEWSLKIGQQIIEWGRTDRIKPNNIFNVQDLSDLLESENIGIPAFRLTRYVGMNELEFVWAPVFTEDKLLYDKNSRWFFFPRTDYINSQKTKLSYVINNDQKPSKEIKSSQFGIRYNSIGTGLDWSILLAKSYDRIPTYFDNETIQYDPVKSEALLQITPNYKSLNIIGMDAAANLDQYSLRSELAYFITKDIKSNNEKIDDPYLQWVWGIDRNYSKFYKDIDLFILFQYALDEEYPLHGLKNQDELYSKFKHFYHQAGLLNIEFKFNEFNKLALKSFKNLEMYDYTVQAEYIYKPEDTVEIILAQDILGGRENGFFGYFDKNDRFRIGIKYYY